MSTILGITDGDDAGAVLLVDGGLVAAVNEERLNRIKMSIGFPELAVQEVLRIGQIGAADVEHVAVAAHIETWVNGAKENKGWFVRGTPVDRVRNRLASSLARPLGGFKFARKGFRVLKRMTIGRRRAKLQESLANMGIDAPITYHEHHRCHALSAYELSGYDDAVSISLDGSGDGSCSHVWVFGSDEDKRIHRLSSIHSIGNFYAYVTHLCGFRANIHEGKITGLSASGDPKYIDIFRDLIEYKDGEIVNKGKVYYHSAVRALLDRLPKDWSREDLSASVQRHLEEVAVPYVQYWVKKSGKRNVCLSGGVFANVLLNQKIGALPECENIFVVPAMGDGGLATGAAYDAFRTQSQGGDRLGTRRSPFKHAYLGPSFSDDEIESELIAAGVEYTKYEDIERVAAKLLHDGRVVARFNGAMEYGPRALGNRTIMYRTTERSVNDWLNKRLHRTEFMPFAPACLAEHTDKLFLWDETAARAARFMTITMDCTDWMTEHCPAVVHIDRTARPQVVDEVNNPSFYKIISHYYELSGIPAIVNTSFNMHEEPIVCTPSDAVRAYQLGRLDNLAIGSFLLGNVTEADEKG
jgi:carbamoyltransferase